MTEFLHTFASNHLGINIWFMIILICILNNYSFKEIDSKTDKLLILFVMLPLIVFEINCPDNAFIQLLYFIISAVNWVFLFVITDNDILY